jgi:hypothetical protein
MKCELRGGPKDGDFVEIKLSVMFDGEMYFPHDERTIEPIATYRWLFGEADHLDFVGYEKPYKE